MGALGLAKKFGLNVQRNVCDVKVDSLNVKLDVTYFLKISYCFLTELGYTYFLGAAKLLILQWVQG
ncbi:protein of unknown function [Candidatus Methylomirabilis oxygeniifera]|uniref:Uncharacterized protein n=1 Tax=Methylomirabilis oxygeniifera TaxID=671143 RepID=D5MH25_METO1|nr:protein of unknown function [Candidatus Methylomirabilis oxyfera]